MIIKKFEAFSNGPVGSENQHTQSDSDIKRSPRTSFSEAPTNESGNTPVLKISDLGLDDIILFRGTKFRIEDVKETTVKAVGIDSGRPILINQGQLSQYGVFLITTNHE